MTDKMKRKCDFCNKEKESLSFFGVKNDRVICADCVKVCRKLIFTNKEKVIKFPYLTNQTE